MAQSIDVLIETLGLPIKQLADMTGLSAERIEAIVNGRWTPRPEERTRIAAAIGVPAESVSWGHSMSPRNVRYHRCGILEPFSKTQ